MKLVLRVLINALALGLTFWLVDLCWDGGVLPLLVIALIFGVINALIRPLVTARDVAADGRISVKALARAMIELLGGSPAPAVNHAGARAARAPARADRRRRARAARRPAAAGTRRSHR